MQVVKVEDICLLIKGVFENIKGACEVNIVEAKTPRQAPNLIVYTASRGDSSYAFAASANHAHQKSRVNALSQQPLMQSIDSDRRPNYSICLINMKNLHWTGSLASITIGLGLNLEKLFAYLLAKNSPEESISTNRHEV